MTVVPSHKRHWFVTTPFVAAIFSLLALLFVLYGQANLPEGRDTRQGSVYVLTAVLCFLLALFFNHPRETTPEPLPKQKETAVSARLQFTRNGRWLLFILSLFFAVIAFLNLAHNQFTPLGTVTWLAAISSFLSVFTAAASPHKKQPPTAPLFSLAFWGLFLLATFFRFYRLPDLPLDTWSDQAEKLLDIYDVLQGEHPIFFVRNTGREAFQFYWTAALIWLTPLDFGFLALKVGTALIGLLTLPFVYLLAQELYGRQVALLATALFAISHWHVVISRVGLRFPLTAAFVAPTLYFLFRAFKENRRNDWLACGLSLGIGLHTYIPMRMVPLLLLLLVGLKTAVDLFQKRKKYHLQPAPTPFAETSALTITFWQNALLGGLTTALVFLPLARYSYDDPEMFWYRAATRTGEVTLSAETWSIFLDNIKNALLMFNYRGDGVVTNTIPFSPQLDLVTGALFLLGVVYLLWRLIMFRDRRTLYVLLSTFVMLLPSILSIAFPGENPSVVRTGGVIPLAMIIAALPLGWIYQRLSALPAPPSLPRLSQWLAGLVTAVLLVAATFLNYQWYFVAYDAHYRNTVWNTVEMGQVVQEFVQNGGDLANAYHVPFPYWADTRLIGLNAGDITWNNSLTDLDDVWPKTQDPAAKLFILHVDDQQNLYRLQAFFPRGQAQRFYSVNPNGKDFMVFYVPPRAS